MFEEEPEVELWWESVPPSVTETEWAEKPKETSRRMSPEKILIDDRYQGEEGAADLFSLMESDTLRAADIPYERMPEDEELFNLINIQQWPVFPGCERKDQLPACFQEKLARHIRKYLRTQKDYGLSGQEARVYIRFEIDRQGKVSRVQGRSPSADLTGDVEGVFQKLPQMQPAVQNGRLVGVYYTIPVRVKL